ncbi:MAG: hypothetical protein FWH06_04085 [Oscillospiraceae bacterium]|nr:hypothetical protein [Oscillospiraceae bacterium]
MADMFGFLAGVAELDHDLKAIQEAIAEAVSNEILVGIPDDANERPENSSAAVTNAELLYIHTNGSEINKIPKRPVIEPALEHSKEQVSSLLQSVADAALSGDIQRVRDAQERAGKQGRNIARAWFRDPANEWAPNADITVKGGWMKNKKTGKKFKAKGKRSSRPLIDTGELRRSITYRVKRK